MTNLFKLIFLLLIFLFFSTETMANEKFLNIDEVTESYHPDNQVYIFEPDQPLLQLPDILKQSTNQWKIFDRKIPLDPKKTYWFKLNYQLSNDKHHWLISPGLWHSSSIFQKNSKGWYAQDMSVFMPLNARKIKHQYPLAVLKPSGKLSTLYFKNKGFRYGRAPIAQNVWLVSEAYLNKKTQDEMHFQGAFLGFSLGLAGFHFILWFWFREKTYLWLVATTISSPIFFHAFYGYGLTLFWPSFPIWNEYSANILASVSGVIYLRFASCYLNLSTQMPITEKFIIVLLYANLFTGLAVFQEIRWLLAIAPILLMTASIIILYCGVRLSVNGVRYAWYFVAGNGLVLICFVLWTLLQIEVISPQWLPTSIGNLTQLASGIQGSFLALGMIDRMQSMKETILEEKLQREKLVRLQAEQTQRLMQVQNAELASANFALKEVDQLKDEFLAKTSHELNTPLNGIIGLSEILLDEEHGFSEKEKREYLELIASRGEHLRQLVVELLEFAQTRRDVVKLYPEQLNVDSQIQKIILTFNQAAQRKNLSLKFDQSVSRLVYVDARRFRQIISIIIDNAIKYTDAGSIRISLSGDQEMTQIEITDTGIGISEDNLPQVFEPFKQIVDTTRSREGAGLGLSICQHLVELHKGTIELHSVLGQGTTFVIRLPVAG